MRLCSFLVLTALLGQERATLLSPKAIDGTVRSYEVVGVSVQVQPTIYKPPAVTPTLATPAVFIPPDSVTIYYIDNLGTHYVDVHTYLGPPPPGSLVPAVPGNDAATVRALVDLVMSGTGGSLRTRLLQHLIDEHKIPPARITKEGK
jgi:hypothetical protein